MVMVRKKLSVIMDNLQNNTFEAHSEEGIASMRHKADRRAAFNPSEAILESISDGVFTVDLDWCITSFNRAAESITGISRTEAIGSKCSEVFRSSMCGESCALQQTVNTGKPIIGKTGYIINSGGNRIPISTSTAA